MSKRPAGLSTLAIFNFVFAGLFALLFSNTWQNIDRIRQLVAIEQWRGKMDNVYNVDGQHFLAIAMIVIALLMVIAAIGYLQQRKWAWFLGIFVALAHIAVTIIAIVWQGRFHVPDLLFLMFPFMCLIMLTKNFKRDFIR